MEKKNGKFTIGVDLGGTKMSVMVYDAQFKVYGRQKKKTKAQEGVSSVIERMCAMITDAITEAGASKNDINGIGIGCPGLVDSGGGTIVMAPNLGWKNVEIGKLLSREFDCPVGVLNDVDAGTYGEYAMGAAQSGRCVVGVFPGTGIGAGCVYKGKIFRGKNRSCFELGHIPVIPNGSLCGCGQKGCLETVAGRLAISTAAAAAAYRGEAPYLLKTVGMDLSQIRSGVLAEAIKAGDSAIEKIVRDAAVWLGVGVAIVVNLVVPDYVVLGGGLVEAMPEIYAKVVEETARQRVVAAYRNVFKVVVSSLGDDAVASGAAVWQASRARS